MEEQENVRIPTFYLTKDLQDDSKNILDASYASNDSIVFIKHSKSLFPFNDAHEHYRKNFDSALKTIMHFEVDSNGTLTISGDIDVIKSIRAYVSYAEKVLERPIKKIIIESTRPLEIEDYFISDCDSLESVVISCPQNIKIYRGTFVRCHNLKEIIITSLSKEFNIDISREKYPDDREPYLENVEIIIDSLSSIKLDDFIRFNSIKVSNATSTNLINYENKNNSYNYENMKNIFIDNLVIDDLSEEGINKLKEIVKNYSLDNIKKITIGDFEIKKELFNSEFPSMTIKEIHFLIFHWLNCNEKIKNLIRQFNPFTFDNKILELLNYSNLDAIESNYALFENMFYHKYAPGTSAVQIEKLFLESPQLLNMNFDVVLKNIEELRKNSSIIDDDIKTCYFNDTNLEIDLNSTESIKNYVQKYILENGKLPTALNSLFFENDENKLIDITDRITYVTTMNLTGEERDAYLYKDGIDIIRDVDNKSFSSIYNDHGKRADIINEKMPYLNGIKTVVYKKMKGYIKQNDDENILFDSLVNPIINDYNNAYRDTPIISYLKKQYEDLKLNDKASLTSMKNIICGRVLYEVLEQSYRMCQYDRIPFDEDNIRNLLSQNSLKYDLSNPAGIYMENSKIVEMMLKIDPYSFDLLRNDSTSAEHFISQPMEKFRKSSNMDFPLDIRYYYIAKANGYRFTKEEDADYEKRIAEFNKKLEEAISNPKYAEFKEDLEKYRIKPVNTKPDIMKVFYEYLQNEIVPANIPLNKQHDFEEKVKVLVDKFIESESKEGTTLSKIIYSVDMLYRNNNPAILYKSTEEILENPKLISNPKISDVEKLGVTLIALNKMAHEQIDDFVPSEFITKFRYNTPNVMAENTNFAKGIIDALTIASYYTDLEWFYKSQFTDFNNSELTDNDFSKYIDNKYQEYYIANLDEEMANSIFDYVKENLEGFKKIINNENTEDISSEVKDFYGKNKIYVEYVINNFKDDKLNPLLESKDIYSKEFEFWKGTYEFFRVKKDDKKLTDTDYFKLFRSMQKVRAGLKDKDKSDVVKHIFDNAMTQKNMYDLKQKFTKILLNKTISELSNDSMESKEILETIATMTIDEKLEMFNKTGMVMEIHEDDNNKNQSVLVLYSKNVSEPYSIHLQENYINDKNREINTNNRIIVNSQLDNKNLTYNNKKHCYNLDSKYINFNNVFMRGNLGRANAILLNFLDIDIPALLAKYGINKELVHEVIKKEKQITTENLNDYLDKNYLSELRNAGLSDDEIVRKVNSIINGINTMIENLKAEKGKETPREAKEVEKDPEKGAKNVLKITDEMELDEEDAYLRNMSFINFNSADVPTVSCMLDKNAISYSAGTPSEHEAFERLFLRLNERLDSSYQKGPEDFYSDVQEIMTQLIHPIRRGEKDLYKVGDDCISFEISSNQAFTRLKSLPLNIDFEELKKLEESKKINYQELNQMLEDYITRILKLKKSKYKGSQNDIIDVINICYDLGEGKLDGKYIDKKCKTSVTNINKELSNEFISMYYSDIIKDNEDNINDLIDSMEKEAEAKSGEERKLALKELKEMVIKYKKVKEKDILSAHVTSDIEKEKMVSESLEDSIKDGETIATK